MGKKIGKHGIVRFTASVEPEDLDLLDRLARLDGTNRSEQLRVILSSLRPTLSATVKVLEKAERTKQNFLNQVSENALGDLNDVLPEVERISNTIIGAMARLEGAMVSKPPASNTGATPGNPPFDLSHILDLGSDEK